MKHIIYIILLLSTLFSLNIYASQEEVKKRKIAYLVSDIEIPFWSIIAKGLSTKAHTLNYKTVVYSAGNSAEQEIKNTILAIKQKVDAIIVSPTSSSACSTLLHLAKKANIPVVIADIGTDEGEYISYISSNNRDGAYNLGKMLTKKLLELNYSKSRVGIVAIPQKRFNGQERTRGFINALNEAGIKGSSLKQQSTFSYKETYDFVDAILNAYSDIHAIWLQGSNRYQAALDAIADNNRTEETLLLTFDAEPEFLELISQGTLLGAAMQQPYLMGEIAVETIDQFLHHKKVAKSIELPILVISKENLAQKLPTIKKNVLGIE